ncbi:hypothetical protein EDD11_007531 [Mortierella claussenii]|nr:hypothetical protein EDD11_007531 [Mortierella claussenii]
MYAKVEAQKLRFLKENQKTLRANLYSVPKFIKTDKYLEVVMKKHKQRKNTIAANGVANMNDDPKADEAAAVGAGSGQDADGRVDLTGDMGGLNGEDREGGSVSTSGSNGNEGESQAEDDF